MNIREAVRNYFVARPRKIYPSPFTNWLDTQAFLFIISALPVGGGFFLECRQLDHPWRLVAGVSIGITILLLLLGIVAGWLSSRIKRRLRAKDQNGNSPPPNLVPHA